MKWAIVQLVENAEEPVLPAGQASLCCPVAHLADQSGYELLNRAETDAYEIGKQVQRLVFTHHLQALDTAVSAQRVHEEGVGCEVVFDGQDPLTFITRFGAVTVPIQQAHCQSHQTDFTPLNRLLPAHEGPITTQSVQELSCLFAALSPSYETGAQLLALALQEPGLLSTSKSERLVETHGTALRQQEDQEAEQVLRADPATEVPALPLRPASAPRRPSLAADLLEAVRQQLDMATLDHPPAGLSLADWTRIVTHWHEMEGQHPAGDQEWFATLGPSLRPGEVLVQLDGVILKGRPKGSRLEECTARIATPAGFWCITGQGRSFQRRVLAALRRLGIRIERLIVVADGAKWIREFYTTELALLALGELILDWYHLQKKCYELLSMVCTGRQARAASEARLRPLLWHGEVDAACQFLETLRPQARHVEKLDELVGYLAKHRAEIPNYDQRRAQGQFNGAGQVEKENDVLVARRQKRRGMQWVAEGADVICALRTLWFNGQWDTYWHTGLTLPFALAA